MTGLALMPDAKQVVSSSWGMSLDIWELETGRRVKSLKGHLQAVNCVALTSDGKRAASGDANRMLKIWDLQTGRELRTITGMPTTSSPVPLSRRTADGCFRGRGTRR